MAAARALSLPELLEGVFALLPNSDVLRLQAVNHTWQKTVQDSPLLKHKLFLPSNFISLPSSDSSPPVTFNPLFPHKKQYTFMGLEDEILPHFHHVNWAEPFQSLSKKWRYGYEERVGGKQIDAWFHISPTTPDKIMSLRQCIPLSAQAMYLSRSDSLTHICLEYYMESYIDTRTSRAFKAVGIELKKVVTVTAIATVTPSTFGELLLVCEEMIGDQPLCDPSIRMEMLGPMRTIPPSRFSSEIREKLVGQEPWYWFYLQREDQKGAFRRKVKMAARWVSGIWHK
ncbi:hypothetical protein PRZ48_008947 [Zasmidium cellare]|uniref:F-box domain-containing protein n=1 Tax=Zasmidium cellare TaxID=395010 RepID=A0ABR0EH09_ZASCE|nr:hypothetical protein PRZ48_008947 [Zasmidium cellare]